MSVQIWCCERWTVAGARARGAAVIVVLALVIGVGMRATVDAQRPVRTSPPVPGSPPAFTLPAVQKRALSNGIPLWIIEAHEVPLVQVNLLVAAGSGADPEGKYGTASLTAAMLDEGAGQRSALEIADVIDGLGATLSTSSSFDASAVRLNVPVARLGDALPVMADVALRPSFPGSDFERVRQERLTDLLRARDEPNAIAATAFAKLVFGPSHRYGTSAMGTTQTITALTPADLREFHRRMFVPGNAALIVVGDVKGDQIVAALEGQFGTWTGTAPVVRPVPNAPQLTTRRIVIVDKPGAPQSQIRIGRVGVARSTPDFFPLEVLNTLFGGSFSSRLNQNLREEHGYTYGASSYFEMRRSAGLFVAGAGVQTDKTAAAVHEFFHEFGHLAEPVPAKELRRTKDNLALGFPGEFETTTQLSRKLEELVVYGLPEDYFSQYINRVRAVTAADVLRVASRRIVPSRLLVVVVGDRKAVEPGLRALKLGAVEVMTVDQVFGG